MRQLLNVNVWILSLALIALGCSNGGGSDKVSITSVTGDGTNGRIRSAVIVQGKNLGSGIAAKLTGTSSTFDLVISSASATELVAQVPSDLQAGDYKLTLSKGRAQASADVSILQGEQGEQGEKGDTGDTGVQGDKGDKGDTGDSGIGGLHLIDNNGVDLGFWFYIGEGFAGLVDSNGHHWDVSLYTGTNQLTLSRLYYTTADCTGSPYFAGGTNFFAIASAATGSSKYYVGETSMRSNVSMNSYHEAGACTVASSSENATKQVEIAGLSFPLAVPFTIEPR